MLLSQYILNRAHDIYHVPDLKLHFYCNNGLFQAIITTPTNFGFSAARRPSAERTGNQTYRRLWRVSASTDSFVTD